MVVLFSSTRGPLAGSDAVSGTLSCDSEAGASLAARTCLSFIISRSKSSSVDWSLPCCAVCVSKPSSPVASDWELWGDSLGVSLLVSHSELELGLGFSQLSSCWSSFESLSSLASPARGSKIPGSSALEASSSLSPFGNSGL